MEQKEFKIVSASKANGHHIYGSQFVDTVKSLRNPNAFAISRFLIQANCGMINDQIIYDTTIQCVFQQLLLALCTLDKDLMFSPVMLLRHTF